MRQHSSTLKGNVVIQKPVNINGVNVIVVSPDFTTWKIDREFGGYNLVSDDIVKARFWKENGQLVVTYRRAQNGALFVNEKRMDHMSYPAVVSDGSTLEIKDGNIHLTTR